MTYTRTWAEVNNLLGSRDSDEIDDASRETHVDLDERFRDIIRDVDADPWVLKVPGVNSDGTQVFTIHPVSGNVFGNVGMDVDVGRAVQPLTVSGAGTWAGPIPVARGSKLTDAAFRVLCAAGATVVCRVVKVDYTGARTVVATGSPAADGVLHWFDPGTMSEVFDQNNILYLEVFLTGNGVSTSSAMFFWASVVIQTAGTF